MKENKGQTGILVSVIMPAYRCTETICQAIDSALQQDVALEILVLNDDSPDDLDTVMEAYRDDTRVRYLKNGCNLGAAATRNRGVSLAGGEYVAFLDSDDWWEAEKAACQNPSGAGSAVRHSPGAGNAGRKADWTDDRSA